MKRPVLRYHGGKYKLAAWLIEHFPRHQTYVEPYAGAASVLMQKPRSYGEVYNDLDSEIVNIFRLLQDEKHAAELCRRIYFTAFARDEFEDAYEEPLDKIDRAHKMIARSFMGFGSAAMTRLHITGFRANANRSGTLPAHDWATWPYHIKAFTERLRGVVIENKDAIEVMKTYDTFETLHYVDPPYVQSTRSSVRSYNKNRRHFYRFDMTDEQHVQLAECLKTLKGMVVLSGYDCPQYRELYPDWSTLSTGHMADGARARVETVWLNPQCAARQGQSRLFA